MYVLLTLAYIMILWIYWIWTRRLFYALILKIPGPLGYPLVGMAHHLMHREDILRTFEVNIKKYGSPMLSWLGTYPFLVISEPIMAQDILTSPKCINKGVVYQALNTSIGQGLFSLDEPHWNWHRRVLNPAFAYKVLLDFIPLLNEKSSRLLDELNKWINSGHRVPLLSILQNYSLTIATGTTMGFTPSDGEKNFDDILKSYQCVLETLTEMCFAPWLQWDFMRKLCRQCITYDTALKNVHQFIKMLIKRNQQSNLEKDQSRGGRKKRHFIDFALQQQEKGLFNQQNVEAECNVIIFGAFETTANTLCHILILLAMFPEYQKKLFEEVNSLFPEKQNVNISSESVKQLVYMDLIINEAMRLLSPVPIVARQINEPMELSNGIVLPKGVQVAIDIFHLHRREDIWGSDAQTFNPDHFLPSNMRDKHAYAFIPFTKGIRNCIGWQYALILIKITLAKIILRYEISTQAKFEDLELVEDITLKIKKIPQIDFSIRCNND